MKSKLVTFGCSFTDFNWPTWADWMGYYYDDVEKIAIGGTGNRAIFHNIIQYLSSTTNLENVQLVIQWSSCTREDKYNKKSPSTEYLSGGCVTNNPHYNQEYVEKYFSFQQTVDELVDYVWVIQNLLKEKEIKFIMTFMLDPTISNNLGELGFNVSEYVKNKDELKAIQISLNKLHILKKKHFTGTCIFMHLLDEPVNIYAFSKDNTEESVYRDSHPSPSQHYTFFRKFIVPKVNTFKFEENSKLLSCVAEWEQYAKIKKPIKLKEHLEPKTWPTKKRYHFGTVKSPLKVVQKPKKII